MKNILVTADFSPSSFTMKLFYIPLFLCFPLAALSQVGEKGSINVSSGVDFLFPGGALATTHNQGFGISLKSEYVFARHVSATVSGSFYHFSGDEAEDLDLIPVLAGLQLRSANQNGFMYAFSVGDEIVTGRRGNSLDISVRIQNWKQETTQRFYGVRVAYEFRLK